MRASERLAYHAQSAWTAFDGTARDTPHGLKNDIVLTILLLGLVFLGQLGMHKRTLGAVSTPGGGIKLAEDGGGGIECVEIVAAVSAETLSLLEPLARTGCDAIRCEYRDVGLTAPVGIFARVGAGRLCVEPVFDVVAIGMLKRTLVALVAPPRGPVLAFAGCKGSDQSPRGLLTSKEGVVALGFCGAGPEGEVVGKEFIVDAVRVSANQATM